MICDDEKAFRLDLKRIVATHLDLQGIPYHLEEFASGEALLESFQENREQILFLDIEMGGLSGMDVAREIRRRDALAVIIFVTSYTDFVFQGYEVRALNYLVKPYEKEKLTKVLDDGLKTFDTSKDTCFFVEQRSGSLRIPFRDIKYFSSKGHQIHAASADKTHSFYGKLSDLEDQLPSCFIRIHNRYIINLSHLDTITSSSAVVAEEALPVSRSCKQELSAAYARYMLK